MGSSPPPVNLGVGDLKGKRIIGTIMQATACVIGAFLIAIALWAFLVDRYDPATGMYFDGFGRQLHRSAGIFGRDLSPGLVWEIIDIAIAIVSFAVISSLFSLGAKLKRYS